MTYLLVTSKYNSFHSKTFISLLEKLWKKDINMEKLLLNPDIHILKNTKKLSIGIEEVKELQNEMQFKPFIENVQIAVIVDAKKLTHQAQNALLKTLEESTDSTAYILLVQNEKDLLPTIVSRSRKIYDTSVDERKLQENRFCFEDTNLISAFEQIEKLSSKREDCIEYLEEYLKYLQTQFKNSIVDGENFSQITSRINLVNITKCQIEANGNKRLILENLYLQIQNSR